jgi:hypothetical protein
MLAAAQTRTSLAFTVNEVALENADFGCPPAELSVVKLLAILPKTAAKLVDRRLPYESIASISTADSGTRR